MELNEVEINYNNCSDVFHIIPVGDIHIGDINCDLEYLKRTLNWIMEKPNRYMIGMGDAMNMLSIKDNRYDTDATDPKFATLESQYKEILRLFKPLAESNKIIGLHTGNHEDVARRRYYYDFTRNLCYDLKVRYLGWDAFTRLIFRRMNGVGERERTTTVVINSLHGFVGGRLRGSKVNALERLSADRIADIYLMAHGHDLFETRRVVLSMASRGTELVEKKLAFGFTGCFVHTYKKGTSGYAERMSYPPSKVGVINITIKPETKDIHMSV